MLRVGKHHQDIILINEYPKSGATWLKLMLADLLYLKPWTQQEPTFQNCIMQGHYLRKIGGTSTVIMYRDPRDVMVSYYHHMFGNNEFQSESKLNYYKSHFSFNPKMNLSERLDVFTEVMLTRPPTTSFTWTEFAKYWSGQDNDIVIRYEDLWDDPEAVLTDLITCLGYTGIDSSLISNVVTSHSIANMRDKLNKSTGVSSGKESFSRKGGYGGWTNYLSTSAAAKIMDATSPYSDRLGYS